jgi:hypothetical protein
MTATITETDRLVSQPQREIVYTARRSDLQLIKTPRYPLRGAMGEQVGETPGITVQFTNGMLRLPLEGEVITAHGIAVDAAELLTWLEGHRLNGDRFEGFIKLEQAAPPVSAEELRALTRASVSLDEAGLQAIIDAEREGWGREDLIGSAQEALDGIQAIKAEAAQQAEAPAKPKGTAKS